MVSPQLGSDSCHAPGAAELQANARLRAVKQHDERWPRMIPRDEYCEAICPTRVHYSQEFPALQPLPLTQNLFPLPLPAHSTWKRSETPPLLDFPFPFPFLPFPLPPFPPFPLPLDPPPQLSHSQQLIAS